jgi:RNA polymerase sigma-B factor
MGPALRLHNLVDHDARRREELIATYMPMATRIARGFAGRGQDLDDLTQVAMLELVRAASKFKPALGFGFAQYAHPCIVGGLKKHFRDNGWSLHVTRRLQERHLQTSRILPGLTQQLGHHPTIAELAVHLHLSETDTRAAVHAGRAYNTQSINAPTRDEQGLELAEIVGSLDPRLESAPDRLMLAQYMAVLPHREQRILHLRFFDGLSQQEISERLGVSQMQISRLLTRSIDRLRTGMLAPAGN